MALASPALSAEGLPTLGTQPNASVYKVRGAVIEIAALRGDIVRVRIGRNGNRPPPDESWAALGTSRESRAPIERFTRGQIAGFTTSVIKVTVDQESGAIVISDRKTGRVLMADRRQAFRADPDGAGFSMGKSLPDDAHYFGLGDKFGPLDLLGRSFAMWNTDSYGFQEGHDPLYKDIPFFVGYTRQGYYGFFLDNTWRTTFDFGHEKPGQVTIAADNGPIDYYVMAGPTPKDVERQYAWLTGTPAMPPRWTLGFQQSRWGYPTEASVRDIVAHLKRDRIPTDAMWLDVDYQQNYRPFTVDPKTFPRFHDMVQTFSREGVHTIAITDLHIADHPNAGYAPYDTGIAQDRFVKKADGTNYIAPVWPGPALFPDFTQKATRDWWGALYRQFYLTDGIAGFWNDMDEPAVFDTPTKTMPLDNIHRIDEPGFASRKALHAEIHNIYGMQNHRATYEGLLALKPNERPYVMTRASYAGGQRYGTTWTGDNSSNWNHLRLTVPMLESLGLGGFAFAGADIGGFAGSPSADLLTRWIEIGMFQPLARDHSDEDSQPQEPWVGGKAQEDIRRRFIEERYRLLPYNYTLAEEAARTGIPMIRPLFMEFPEGLLNGIPLDLAAWGQFMWGPSLMVAPPPTPESPAPYSVTLPAGGWYDYWTGKPVSGVKPLKLWGASGMFLTLKDEGAASPHALPVTPRLDQLPVFVRAGSIIPRQALVQSTDETPKGPLEIDVYPGANCHGSVYADDGHSFDYRNGAYSRTDLTCMQHSDGSIDVSIGKPEGSYTPWWHSYHIVVHGVTRRLSQSVIERGHTLAVVYDADQQSVALEFPTSADAIKVALQ
ncbi:alpha-glucosidase 2 [Neoasaia chiangmaiensis NBRC 101099]|uniref:Uncharacterized protein n=1 Tax=Neoasaia chiangmaiensis TaxID=320497 RepID=A0A1U9KLM0_9PROT|nr:TIM-barrel domain-containing protein [Neoasaia chiangmaiensis]AQS86695.1 hypothetical protein A0U93_00605 [Neoasaia chiangmaiensis]GBR36864.1 alpha-glucosidase 2 [Neoasaia chiangmaiensis NBRC 101099]GEN16708.1 alpha-glucosidase [Neoasaia chiangmaiensis]